MTWPALDGGGALLMLILMASALAQSDEDYLRANPDRDADQQRREATLVSGIFAAVASASAVYGYTRVSKCKDAREAYAAAHPRRPAPPANIPLYRQQGAPPFGAPPPQQGDPPAPYPPPPQQGDPLPPGPAVSPGVEGGPCLADGTCDAGLMCGAGSCVRPAEP